LYTFDCRLRLLLLQATERVEIAFRTAVTYQIAINYGPFGHVNSANFAPDFKHTRFMQELADEEARSREEFVAAYRLKYHREPDLPVWKATELISFGTVSLLYKHMRPDLQRAIAATFGVSGDVLKNWMHTISYVRNKSAHHCRMWNRKLAIRPVIPRRWTYDCPNNALIYSVLLVLNDLILRVSPESRWKDRLINLFLDFRRIDLRAMGFPADWLHQQPWCLCPLHS
jgi:abortive infection bacteriophage resistance protein